MASSQEILSFVSSVSKRKIEVNLNPLPAFDDIINILTNEKALLKYWIITAKNFYHHGFHENYAEILDHSREKASLDYNEADSDQMILLDGLAAHYVNLARKEKNKETKREHLIRATRLYTAADKIIMLNEDHLIGRAFLCLQEPDKIDQADAQFNFVLDQNPDNVLAVVGKARIYFVRNEIKLSLSYYRKALNLFPDGFPFIRVGIGMCLYKMGKIEMAKMAFERAIEMDGLCVPALVALSIIRLNEKSPENVKLGMQLLSTAYSIDSSNPFVLNILADHFFYKQEYSKVERLATLAMQHTNNDHVRAYSFYLLGRCYHVKKNYDNSFNYYYQSTQLASSKFVLPWFGLGQIYLKRDEIDNAINCFEKVLAVSSNNIETIKLVCLCYLKSNREDYLMKAKDLYKKMVHLYPNEEDSWIGLAEVYQSTDLGESLKAFNKAIELMTAKQTYISPEIYNNIGSIYFRLENFNKAKEYFELALNHIDQSCFLVDTVSQPITATVRYNLARTVENLSEVEKAQSIYQEIIKDFPDYIDCYLRQGCIARNRGDFREASDWFNMALKVDAENSEAWLNIANLHFTKNEFGPAQKKFEKVMSMSLDRNNPDIYACLSIANIWLCMLNSSLNDPEKKKKFSERCLTIYKNVLKKDCKNICAANGIGCVLAYNSYISMARDVFSQCREATADILDIWLNLGHIYMENKQFINAIKMYESCYDKFCSRLPNTEILIYLARAYFKAQQLIKAKKVLIKLLFYSPRDILALFNLSIILEKNASNMLKNDRAALFDVEAAISQLEVAQRNFSYLVGDCGQCRIDPTVCENEKRACSDLIIQGNYRLQRAQQQQEAEEEMIRIHKEKLVEITRLQAKEEESELMSQKQREQELFQKRAQYLKNAQRVLQSMPSVDESKNKKNRPKINNLDESPTVKNRVKKRKMKVTDAKLSSDKKIKTSEFINSDDDNISEFSEAEKSS
ncbi:hypothetical protein HZS_6784 [Henneguya salminicola]|nr:hypothetical protein HZS_6784 [Henneguya salminicola]